MHLVCQAPKQGFFRVFGHAVAQSLRNHACGLAQFLRRSPAQAVLLDTKVYFLLSVTMQLHRLVLMIVAMVGFACSRTHVRAAEDKELDLAKAVLARLRQDLAPDRHLAIFDVAMEREGKDLVAAGELDSAKNKEAALTALHEAGIEAKDRITLLPDKELGDTVWGISTMSVANGREDPEQKAELGTQILMGNVVRVWKRYRGWLLIQSMDGYLSWTERGNLVRCNRAAADGWQSSPLLIVTGLEGQVLEQPRPGAQAVCDIVMGNLVKKAGEQGNWFLVELPDGRKGALAKSAAQDYPVWKKARHATPEKIEQTARLFMGRPYLWGGNSPKGMDCSGFCKLVFLMNGIDLNRNASHQALQGMALSLRDDLTNLKKGDLLFFGHSRGGERPRVSHVGIYLGNKTFIQSSQRVRISSLDPDSSLFDEQYGRSLIGARRILP
jgi:cell wall-associated NlpC family hydrolase